MSATVHVIAGPTASGKSAMALRLASSCAGILINADSMQIYDGLPILSARPTTADLAQAPHLLYGFLPPDQSYSAARWRRDALAAIRSAHTHGRTPILVGGTGLYLMALLKGFSDIPDVPDTVRAEIVALQAEIGTPALHTRLLAEDPVMGARLHSNDTQRVIRAFEVLRATGQSLSTFQAGPRTGAPEDLDFDITLIMPDRDTLYARCDTRFEEMLRTGALEEVSAFRARYGDRDIPGTRTLGYRALRAYLQGILSKEAAAQRACQETRNYAKRQMTWFRHQDLSGSGRYKIRHENG